VKSLKNAVFGIFSINDAPGYSRNIADRDYGQSGLPGLGTNVGMVRYIFKNAKVEASAYFNRLICYTSVTFFKLFLAWN